MTARKAADGVGGFCEAGGAAFSSESDEWETPQALFDGLDAEFCFTLDAASTDSNAKCARHYTEADDGLAKDWGGRLLQPSLRARHRAVGREGRRRGAKAGHARRAAHPARTDTAYFHDHLYGKAELRFVRGRVRFCRGGAPQGSAPFPSMVAILGREEAT